jgi:hypothetical protein
MAFEVHAYAGRTVDFTVPIFEDDGSTAIVLAASDVVRCKVGRGTATPDLDIDSVAALSGGSLVTVDTLDPASVTVRLAQADTLSLSGIYDVEVSVVDDSETAPADAIKAAEKGSIGFSPAPAGDIGKT